MHLTALNAKSEPESELVSEFSWQFAGEDPELIQSAFRAHRQESKFFPAISEIAELIAAEKKRRREAADLEAQRLERARTAQARAEGKLIDFASIRKLIADTVKRMPDPPGLAKWHRYKERKAMVATPTVQLTPEQIAARREHELAEIARYEEEASGE